jgi:hypothetical protein
MDRFPLRSMSYGGLVAEPVIGRRFAPTRWLAMTVDGIAPYFITPISRKYFTTPG